MKKMLIGLLLFCPPALGAVPLELCVKFPFSWALVAPEGLDNWNGTAWGIGISAGLVFTPRLSLAYQLGYTVEKYRLPESEFITGSRLSMANLENGLDFRIVLFPRFRAGAGFKFISQLDGAFGSRDVEEREISGDYLGTDIYLCLMAEYCFHITDRIFIPAEIRMETDLTISDSTVLRTTLSLGCGITFDILMPDGKQSAGRSGETAGPAPAEKFHEK